MDVEVEPTDKAAEAFDAVRDKLAGLTRAVDSMAGEWKALTIPDYSPTLENMAAAIKANNASLDDLADMPALQMGPQQLSAAIIKAGKDARADDLAAIATATSALREHERSIASVVASARTAEQQDKWLYRAGAIGAAVGAFLAFALPTIAVSFAPDSWHWPERRAASILGGDMWFAGERLQAAADQQRWAVRSDFERMTVDGKARVAACLRNAAKAQTPTKCDVVLKAPKPEAR